MEEYRYLLDIAVILALTKSFSLFSRKVNMPPVVGALIAGIILGPVMLNDPESSRDRCDCPDVSGRAGDRYKGTETQRKSSHGDRAVRSCRAPGGRSGHLFYV